MNEGLDLLRQLLPYLSGRLKLKEFTAVCLALGAIDDRDPLPDPQTLTEILIDEGGNVSATARRLGVCTKTIYRRLAKSASAAR